MEFFVSRKIVYPLFVVIILIAFFGLLFTSSFSQSLFTIDENNRDKASIAIIGSNIEIQFPIKNISSHEVNGIKVLVDNGKSQTSAFIKGAEKEAESVLMPGEEYLFKASFPIGESDLYNVAVTAPFNRTIYLSFPIDATTLDPVKPTVSIPFTMSLNNKYYYSVNLCNQSDSELSEVYWVESAEPGTFKESFIDRKISLPKNQCQTLGAYLTPIKVGKVTVNFSLRVGALNKSVSQDITVTDD